MKRTLKTKLVFLLLFLLTVSFVFVFTLGSNRKAFANETKLVEGTFEMEDGVSLKFNEDGGIRFIVKMSDEVKEYIVDNDTENKVDLGFVIAPTILMYDAHGDYLNMPKKLTSTVEESKIYTDGTYWYANGCITKVYEANRKIDFSAIAYITDGTSVQYTEFNSLARNNLYDVVNTLFIGDSTDKILALDTYSSWYGKGDFPISIYDANSYDAVIDKANEGLDLSSLKVSVEKGVEPSKSFVDETKKPNISVEDVAHKPMSVFKVSEKAASDVSWEADAGYGGRADTYKFTQGETGGVNTADGSILNDTIRILGNDLPDLTVFDYVLVDVRVEEQALLSMLTLAWASVENANIPLPIRHDGTWSGLLQAYGANGYEGNLQANEWITLVIDLNCAHYNQASISLCLNGEGSEHKSFWVSNVRFVSGDLKNAITIREGTYLSPSKLIVAGNVTAVADPNYGGRADAYKFTQGNTDGSRANGDCARILNENLPNKNTYNYALVDIRVEEAILLPKFAVMWTFSINDPIHLNDTSISGTVYVFDKDGVKDNLVENEWITVAIDLNTQWNELSISFGFNGENTANKSFWVSNIRYASGELSDIIG